MGGALEILVDRMRRGIYVDATVGAPRVAYRECIKRRLSEGDLSVINPSLNHGVANSSMVTE